MIKILRKELFTWAIGCKTYPDLSGRTKAVFLPQIHGPVCKKFQVFYKNYQNEWVSKVSGYKDQNPKKKKNQINIPKSVPPLYTRQEQSERD